MSNALSQPAHSIPDLSDFARILSRLIVALIIGTAVGLQRESARRTADVRTHVLVALRTALISWPRSAAWCGVSRDAGHS